MGEVANERNGTEAGRLPRGARVRPRQGLVGLALCGLVIGAWLGLHVAAVFFFPLAPSTLPLAVLVSLTQCWLTVGAFIVAHDAMHGSLAPGHPRLNGAIGAFILALYAGFGWKQLRDAHMAHHSAPGTEADPDFFAGDPEHFWPWYRTFFRRYFGWRSVLFVSTVVTIYALAGASVFNIVLFYGAPAIGSSLQLFFFGTYLPHRHEEDAAFVDEHRARTRDLGWLASLLSCFHFGYHHEHHLSPWVPWWALPAEHRRLATATAPAAR